MTIGEVLRGCAKVRYPRRQRTSPVCLVDGVVVQDGAVESGAVLREMSVGKRQGTRSLQYDKSCHECC